MIALSVRVEAMKRRSGAVGGYPAKRRPRKALRLKGRKASKAVTRRGSAPAGHETEVARLTRELHEALERQTATSEVLRVISSSPSQLESVFQTILANATRICEAKFGNLWLREGDNARVVATHGAPSAYREYLKSEPVVVPAPGSALARVLTNREVVQIEDITEAPTHDMKVRLATIKLAKARSLIGVPLVKEKEVIGAIAIYRQEVRSFSEKQVELLKSFASQAVIAIENARLLTELRQRTADLSESLEQQIATSEVLQVVGSSPGDLDPVFAAMLEKAARVCDANFGNIYRWDGDTLHLVGIHNTPTALAESRRQSQIRPNPLTPVGRMLATKTTVHIADLAAEPMYAEERDPSFVGAVSNSGVYARFWTCRC
jgi:GAF domain-containing protein